MSFDFQALSDENRSRYGTDIRRIGHMLLADRYDDRTHFIFELLQNAEDALGRRQAQGGPRRVKFSLTKSSLSVSHFGRVFDDRDVRGVCGIGESTKDHLAIGRFGIGFKSVYTFTDRPEIHSGEADFAIENYVQPKQASRRGRETDETVIFLPFKSSDVDACDQIAAGLRKLGPASLLFLRHIDEIDWRVEGGGSGVYMRSPPEILGPGIQRTKVRKSDGPAAFIMIKLSWASASDPAVSVERFSIATRAAASSKWRRGMGIREPCSASGQLRQLWRSFSNAYLKQAIGGQLECSKDCWRNKQAI